MSTVVERLRAALADHYAIEREIGAGGMATVYLAEDLKHRRKVAVKVLRPDLAAALGTERFLREIEVAAQITHPHVLPLYDSGEAGGFLYYVMPYIEGESLRERLEREGELPVTEAVRLIREVVDALAFAHQHGVVHRDIKPDNVLLAGRHAMVTDFGVAKAVSEATGRQQLTTAGVALGTPVYMAPEQATADPHIDHRADIYAVGVMAYELLTGRPPFTGNTPQQILAAHVTEAPASMATRRTTLPAELDQFVLKCLAKRPADRWQTAEEMLPLLETLATPSGGLTPTATVPVSAVPNRRSVALAPALVVAVAAVGLFGWSLVRDSAPTITIANFRQLTNAPEMELDPAISPDGREVVYAAGYLPNLHLYVRDLGGGRPIPLTADRPGVQYRPRWTSDGSEVVFLDVDPSSRTFRGLRVPRFGGTAQAISAGPVWDVREGRVVSDRRAGLFLQPLSGGDSILVPTESRPHSAVWSPDGNALAFVLGNLMFGNPLTQIGSIAPSAIWTVALDGGAPTMVAGGDGSLNTSPAWMPDGRTVLFVSDRDGPRDVYAIRLDAALRPRGNPVRVTTGLNPHSVTLSADGRALAFAQLTFRTNIMEIPIPSSGSSSIGDARPLTSGNQIVENHGASLDGRWLAYDSNLEGNQDIYLVSTNGGEARRITTDPGDDFHPDPSPDGSEVVFYSTRFGLRDLFLISADGTGEIRLTDDPRDERHPAFSPDGLAIAFEAAWPRNNVYVITREAVGAPWSAPRQITTTTGRHPRWSRDGSRILYNTDANEIGIVTLSGEDHRVFSARSAGFTGAEWPLWSPDGRSVYFTGADSSGAQGLYSMPAEGGIPRVLIRFDDPSKQLPFSFSVSDDKVYLSVTQYDSDIFVTDIEIR